MPEATLAGRLAAAATTAEQIHFVGRDEQAETLSYREILGRARRVAGGLKDAGVSPGDRVAIVLPTSPDFMDAFFGATLAGAVPVPLYPPVRLGRLDEFHARTSAMLTACGARMVLTDRRIRRLLGESVERARPELGCHGVTELFGSEADPVERAPDDVAFIQFSSGTTRDPKPVALTHRQIFANVRAILGAITRAYPEGPQRDGSMLHHLGVSWLPLYHDMGLVGAVLSALDHTGSLALIPPELFVARPASWLRAIARYGGTISPAPNFAYALCVDRVRDEEIEGLDLSSWRVALNGAEPVTPRVLERFIERFEPYGLRPEALTPVYGLAEATLAVTFSAVDRPFTVRRFDREGLTREASARVADEGHALASVGRPLPGFDVRIVDESGAELAPERIGRIWIRGPSLMAGYHGLPEATAAARRGEWLDTGDMGFLFDDELYLYGRAKDLIVLRGRNYAPQDVEQVADAVPGVRTGCCAALGLVAEDGDGEVLVLLVERAADDDSDDLALRVSRAVTARLGLVPQRVVLLSPGTLPRTSSGKIRRSEAGRQLVAGELRPPATVTPLRLLGAMARSSIGFARTRRASR